MPNTQNRLKMDSSALQVKEKDMLLYISNYNSKTKYLSRGYFETYYKFRKYPFTSFLCATYTKKC